jgi:hypothetical protein
MVVALYKLATSTSRRPRTPVMPGHNHVRAILVLVDGPQRPGRLPLLIRRRLVRVERDVLVRFFERNGELRSTVALGIVGEMARVRGRLGLGRGRWQGQVRIRSSPVNFCQLKGTEFSLDVKTGRWMSAGGAVIDVSPSGRQLAGLIGLIGLFRLLTFVSQRARDSGWTRSLTGGWMPV